MDAEYNVSCVINMAGVSYYNRIMKRNLNNKEHFNF